MAHLDKGLQMSRTVRWRRCSPSRRYSRIRINRAWNDCLLLVNANSKRDTALKRYFSSDVRFQMLTRTFAARITRSSATWSSVDGRSVPSLRPSRYCWVYRVARPDSSSMVRSGVLRLYRRSLWEFISRRRSSGVVFSNHVSKWLKLDAKAYKSLRNRLQVCCPRQEFIFLQIKIWFEILETACLVTDLMKMLLHQSNPPCRILCIASYQTVSYTYERSTNQCSCYDSEHDVPAL